jgi:hypothetical protein
MSLLFSGQTWRITSSYFVAGIIVAQDGVIVKTAPILKKFNNWAAYAFEQHCTKQGWKVEKL